jgi:hypothetical protein
MYINVGPGILQAKDPGWVNNVYTFMLGHGAPFARDPRGVDMYAL